MERTYKYKYVINEESKTVVALSTFAGKVVRGVARCAPNDVFDVEKGKKLAAARCAMKIAHKRLRRAEALAKWANDTYKYYEKLVEEYDVYELNAIATVRKAAAELKALEDSMN